MDPTTQIRATFDPEVIKIKSNTKKGMLENQKNPYSQNHKKTIFSKHKKSIFSNHKKNNIFKIIKNPYI